MSPSAQGVGGVLVGKLVSRLRFPQLFLLALALFALDLLIPDLIPFVDEALLGLATFLLGSWKQRKQEPEKPPMKDITPKGEATPETTHGGKR